MTAELRIHGGTLVDPASGVHARRDLLIRHGRVAAVSEPQGAGGRGAVGTSAVGTSAVGTKAVGTGAAGTGAVKDTIDATGCLVLPGLIDMHVHLREPGYEYKETVETGTRAAVAGGFTAVACMANTDPVNDNAAVTEYIRERATLANLARVYPIGAVSKALQGEELAEIGEMHRAGIVAVSDDGMPIMNGGLMRRALEYSAMFGLAVIVHEQDACIAAEGVMHEGAVSLRLGLKGIPAAAEEAMIARDIALLARTGGRLHVAHLSTAAAVELVRDAKRRGLTVTAEVTPHHFTLTDAAVEGYNTNAKMNPPLRTQHDVEAVRQGLADGTIEVIATDHAPHHRDEKEVEFDQAANGIVGLETALGLALRMADEIHLPLDRLVAAMSTNPARILGVNGGRLAVGDVADVTIVDPARRWTVDPSRFQSKSRNTPFGSLELQGQAVVTMVGGRVVWRAESAAETPTAVVRA